MCCETQKNASMLTCILRDLSYNVNEKINKKLKINIKITRLQIVSSDQNTDITLYSTLLHPVSFSMPPVCPYQISKQDLASLVQLRPDGMC